MHQKNPMRHHANKAGRWRRATAIGAAFLATFPAGSPVAAAMSDDLSLPGMHALQHRDLQRQRGGFSVAGLQINFGFSIETMVNDKFTVVSNFNVSTPGQVTALGTTVAQLTGPTAGSGDSDGGDAMPSAANLIADVNKAIGVSSGESTTQAVLSSVAENVDQKLSAAFSGSGKPAIPHDTEVVTPVPAAVSAPITQPVAAEPLKPVSASMPNPIPVPVSVPAPAGIEMPVAPAAASQPVIASPPAVELPVIAPSGSTTVNPAVVPPAPQSGPLPASTPPVAVASASPLNTPVPVAGDTVAPSAPKISVTQSAGISGTGNASIAVPVNNAQQFVVGDAATTQVIHDMLNGQLAVIKNTLNDVSIQQSVIMNFSVENFTNFRAATQNIRGLSSISRHVTSFSLQR